MDPFTAGCLQRGAEHLHRLGARTTAELLAGVGGCLGGTPCILNLLAECECRLALAMLCVTGGDRFPPCLQTVPR
jgi:hypothetical protein